MSFLTKLPLQRYDSNAFGAFASEEGFSLGKGKAMAWMSQLAYELDEPDILQSRSKERCGSLRGNVLTSTGWRAPRRFAHALREEVAMKSNYKIAAAVIGSFVLGLGAASVLHAQAKPPAYGFVEVDVKNEDGYKKDFLPKAQANIKEFGGKYIAGGFNKAISFSGSPPPNRVVLLQFADMDTLKAFEEKEQRNIADVGSKYASFRVIGIEGVEQK